MSRVAGNDTRDELKALQERRMIAKSQAILLTILLAGLTSAVFAIAVSWAAMTMSSKAWSWPLEDRFNEWFQASLLLSRFSGLCILLSHLGLALANAPLNSRDTDNTPCSYRGKLFALMVSVGCFAFASGLYLSFSQSALLIGTDGSYIESLFYSQRLWGLEPEALGLGLGSNYLQGLGGNISFPLNTLLDIGYALSSILTGRLDLVVSHVTWGIAILMSTTYLGYCAQLPVNSSVLGGWIAAFLIIIPSPARFYPVTALVPHQSTSIAACTCILAVYIATCSGNRYQSIWKDLLWPAVAITALALYVVATTPATTMLSAPLVSLVLGISCIATATRTRRALALKTLLPFLFSLLFLFLTGTVPYIVGLFSYSAASLFSSEWLSDRGSWSFASTMFYGSGRVLIPLAAMGFLAMLRNGKRTIRARILGASGIAATFLTLLTGAMNMYHPSFFRLPSPIYFEFYLWPLYAVSIAYLTLRILEEIRTTVAVTHHYVFRYPLSHISTPARLQWAFTQGTPAIILGLATLLVGFISEKDGSLPKAPRNTLPPPLKEIMSRLVSIYPKIPPSNYSGRLATFTGQTLNSPISWMDLHTFDNKLIEQLENDFRMSGLWVKSIPTLMEYSPIQSPRSYFFLTRFFALSKDRQTRSVLTLRNIDARYLEMIGISTIVTDKPTNDPRLRLEAVEQTRNSFKLYLYRLTGANISGWGPTRVITKRSAKDAVEIMKRREYQPRKTVIVESHFSRVLLSPIASSEIQIRKGSYLIKAKSNGRSMLVLPIEYSSCFRFRPLSESSELISAVPANIALMGIEFERSLDIEMTYRNSLFSNSYCRIIDYQRFRATLRAAK
jgi:hypothetical protein